MPPSSDITVAISTLDRPDDLRRCLDALARGVEPPEEVVVVDQSDDDRTRAVVEERAAGAPPVVYVRQRARGLAIAQNAAVRAARHPLVAVTDDDCIPHPEWIATLRRVMAARPDLACLAGRVLPAEPVGDRVHPVSSRVSDEPAEFSGRSLPWPVGSGNNFCLRREWFERVGGCDERLGPGSPGQGAVDMDLFYRLLRAGGRIRYEPAALVLHERATAGDRLARRYPYGFGMGAACVMWLRGGDRYAVRVLGAWLAMRLAIAARGARARRPRVLREEALVLWGTLRGLLHGARAPRRP